jgi:hypothetical protein
LFETKTPYWGKIRDQEVYIFSSSELGATDWPNLIRVYRQTQEKPGSWDEYDSNRFKVLNFIIFLFNWI